MNALCAAHGRWQPGTTGLKRAIRSLAVGSLLLQAAWAQEPIQVSAVRFWSLADVTRIAIETTGEFTYKYDRLQKPSRIYYDIQNARPEFIGKGIHSIPVADSRVKQIRVSETRPMVTRIVLDLEEGDFDILSSQLTVPDRLVVEVRSKAAVAADANRVLSSTGGQRIAAGDAKAAPPSPSIEPSPKEKPAEPVARAAAVKAASDDPKPPADSEKAPPSEPRTVAMAAKRNSNGSRSLTRALGLKVRRVVVDAGHGGHDHGTTGANGLIEKELVLDVATRLGALIEERMGSEVIYTRNSDRFIDLEERSALANQKKADLFLSIHANSSPLKGVSGAETYYLSFTTSREAMDLAARENASSQRSVHELQDLIQKIALYDKVNESREFAGKVQSALERVAPGRSAKNRGVKKAPFVVLIGSAMPAILAEIGFVSNQKEEALLKTAEYRQKIAETLYEGLAAYADTLSHSEVAQTKSGGNN